MKIWSTKNFPFQNKRFSFQKLNKRAVTLQIIGLILIYLKFWNIRKRVSLKRAKVIIALHENTHLDFQNFKLSDFDRPPGDGVYVH